MPENPFEYKHYCKYCGVYPIVEGPHHKEDCPRWHPTLRLDSELAHRYECRFCGARPFVAGPHHRKWCKRWIPK